MKATGIVRRIDDLGRVVIPREIRRTLNIKEGDPLELYTIDDGICFKKYDAHISRLTEACMPIIHAAMEQGLTIDLYYDECRLTPSKTAPFHLNEVKLTIHGLGVYDCKELQATVRGCGCEAELAKIYLRIIQKIAVKELGE